MSDNNTKGILALTKGVRLRGSIKRGATNDQLDARRASLVDRDTVLRENLTDADRLIRGEIIDALNSIKKQISAIDRRIDCRMRRWNRRQSTNNFGGF